MLTKENLSGRKITTVAMVTTSVIVQAAAVFALVKVSVGNHGSWTDFDKLCFDFTL